MIVIANIISLATFIISSQSIYLLSSLIIIIFLLPFLKNLPHKTIHIILTTISIFLVLVYIIKTSIEEVEYYKLFRVINPNILPFDACSIIMFAGLIASFGKGKIKSYAESWIAIGGLACGLASMFHLNALELFPFTSSLSLYSMLWHFLMVFLSLLLLTPNYVELKWKTVLKAFLFHLVFSLIVIPIDFIFNLDFMFYLKLTFIPIFGKVAFYFTSIHLQFLNPLMMLFLYFILFNVVFIICIFIKYVFKLFYKEKTDESKSYR